MFFTAFVYLNILSTVSSINIGLLYSSEGIFSSYGITVPYITNYWLQNRNSSIPIVPYYCNIASNASLVSPCLNSVLNNNISFLVAPETFLAGVTMAELKKRNRLDIPVISSMAATPDVFLKNNLRAYNNLIGVMSPSFYYFRTLLPYFYIYGLTKISIITSTAQPDNSVCMGALGVVNDYLTLSYFGQFTNDLELNNHMHKLKDYETDVLIVCHRLGCETTVNILNNLDINPSALALFECANFVSNLKTTLQEKIKFIYSPLQWDYRLKGLDFTDPSWGLFPSVPSAPSALQFYNKLSSFTPYPLSSLAPSQMASLYVIENAVRRCPSCQTPSDFLPIVASTYIRTFYGLIRFDDMGMNDGREMTIVQVDNNYNLQIISPLASASSKSIVPMPTWKERVYSPNPFNYPIEIFYYVLLSIFTIFVFSTLFLMYKYREHNKLKSLSLKFLSTSVIGMWIWSFAPLSWKIEENEPYICNIRTLLWTIPPIIYIIPFAVKTMRIHIIFNSYVFTVHRNLTDLHLGKWTLLCFVPFVILSLVGTSIAKHKINIVDINRPLYNRLVCTLPNAYLYFYISVFIFLVIWSSILAYRIRHTNQQYNDSKAMSYLFYNLTFISVVVVACHFAIDSEIALYGIRTLALMVHLISALIIYIERIVSQEIEEKNNSLRSEVKVKVSNASTTIAISSPTVVT